VGCPKRSPKGIPARKPCGSQRMHSSPRSPCKYMAAKEPLPASSEATAGEKLVPLSALWMAKPALYNAMPGQGGGHRRACTPTAMAFAASRSSARSPSRFTHGTCGDGVCRAWPTPDHRPSPSGMDCNPLAVEAGCPDLARATESLGGAITAPFRTGHWRSFRLRNTPRSRFNMKIAKDAALGHVSEAD
jgi:hypothetical protein